MAQLFIRRYARVLRQPKTFKKDAGCPDGNWTLSDRLRFGRFELRPAERRLLHDDGPVRLGARAFDLLVALVEHRARLLTKAELLDLVWPGLVVEEANVQVQISALRKVLGAEAVATIPGLGYRFAVSLKEDTGPAPPSAEPHVLPVANTGAAALADPLIGRDDDVARLLRLLARHRVVTVLGPGGVGKTRLAHEVVRRCLDQTGETVCWVDLGSLSSPTGLASTVAQAARLELGADDALSKIAALLSGRQLLIVLDNCEHLVAAAARLVEAALPQAPGVHWLVTSQEPLGLPGELRYRLETLQVPPDGTPLEFARRFSAVQMLEIRARAADRLFQLEDRQIAEVIRLCRRLDGLPLALEMAAVRLPLLGPAALLASLDHRLRMWRHPSRGDMSAHQRTLGATLDWSHALLDAREQAVLRRLSVLAGAFQCEPAQEIAALGDLDKWDVLEALAGLVDKSWVQLERGDPPRYRLLESMRLYASARLADSGEAAQVAQRHGATLSRMADAATVAWWQLTDEEWLHRHGAQRGDLNAAFERAVASRDAAVAASTAQALCCLDEACGNSAAVRARKQALWPLLPVDDEIVAAGLWSCLAWHGGIAIPEVPRLHAAREAANAWGRVGDRRRTYLALWNLAAELAQIGDADAARATAARAADLEDRTWPARLRWVGAQRSNDIGPSLGDLKHYRERGTVALALAVEAGGGRQAAWSRLSLGDQALMAGDVANALAFGNEAVQEMRKLDLQSGLAWALSNLCGASLAAGEIDAARDAALEALPLMWRNGWGADLLNHVALLCARTGRPTDAARLLGYVDHWYATHQDGSLPNEARSAELANLAVRRVLGEREQGECKADGARMSDVQMLALARAMLDVRSTLPGVVRGISRS